MIKGNFPVDKFEQIETPFYYYDTNLLRTTLQAINAETKKHEQFDPGGPFKGYDSQPSGLTALLSVSSAQPRT